MVSAARIKAQAERLRWLARYWVLDKYRREIFIAAAAIAIAAAVGLAVELGR